MTTIDSTRPLRNLVNGTPSDNAVASAASAPPAPAHLEVGGQAPVVVALEEDTRLKQVMVSPA